MQEHCGQIKDLSCPLSCFQQWRVNAYENTEREELTSSNSLGVMCLDKQQQGDVLHVAFPLATVHQHLPVLLDIFSWKGSSADPNCIFITHLQMDQFWLREWYLHQINKKAVFNSIIYLNENILILRKWQIISYILERKTQVSIINMNAM